MAERTIDPERHAESVRAWDMLLQRPSPCLYGRLTPDGGVRLVLPHPGQWTGGRETWPTLSAFVAHARGQGRACAVLTAWVEPQKGKGVFGGGMCFPDGVVVAGPGWTWETAEAFEREADGRGFFLLRWFPAPEPRPRQAARPAKPAEPKPEQASGAGQGSAFYATAGIQPDGTLQEIGGEGRTWPSVKAFHEARGWRAGTLVTYYPADFGKAAGAL